MRWRPPWAAGLLTVALVISAGCSSSIPSHDAATQAAAFGVDYPRVVSKSRQQDHALRQFFLLSFVVDASGQNEYATDLRRTLDIIGEDRFLRVLQSTGFDVQEQVLATIRHHEGLDQEDNGHSWSRFVMAYPRLAQMAHRSASQPGLAR